MSNRNSNKVKEPSVPDEWDGKVEEPPVLDEWDEKVLDEIWDNLSDEEE